MVRTKEGVYAAKAKKVVILWDLDNKPPRGLPYEVAWLSNRWPRNSATLLTCRLTQIATLSFTFPSGSSRNAARDATWISSNAKGFPPLPSLTFASYAGKKQQRFKERFIDGNEKYNEAARNLLTPKIGYGLAHELRRAGVYVKTVQDKPQAADWALKRQMLHSMSRRRLDRAREANLGTVVVGDRGRALGGHADVWVRIRVENGEIKESDLELKSKDWTEFDERSGRFSVSEFDGDLSSGEQSLDELVGSMEVEMVSEGLSDSSKC
ncbi:hypothetical protein DH2020_002104 [Rehmannia glutinosa]|uniref:Uncharacterized protein n=1 Tax=Rehmannia glutinosa TaxID=99300 RepID=A0ABR0XT59_REHGL